MNMCSEMEKQYEYVSCSLVKITAFFAFLKYRIGNKGNMSMVIAGMDWRKAVFF